MALDKNITPGTRIRVNTLNGKTSGIIVEGAVISALTLWETPGIVIATTATINDELVVLKKPRKVNSINLCRVETLSRIQGEVYWTELRSNCELVQGVTETPA